MGINYGLFSNQMQRGLLEAQRREREERERAIMDLALNSSTPIGATKPIRAAAGPVAHALEQAVASVLQKTGLGPTAESLATRGGDLVDAVKEKLGGKGRQKIASVRDVSPDEALRIVREGGHLVQNPTTGQYVGAPRGIDTPEKLEAARRTFDDQVEAGQAGGDWYKRAADGVREIAGKSPAKQRQTARGLGLMSSQANPETNLGFYLRAQEGASRGRPVSVAHTGAQARKFNTAYESGTDIPLGSKTEPFANKFDPTEIDTHIPVNDIWHLRALGFVDDTGKPWHAGGTPQMHAYADGETLLAADRANARQLHGRDDWDAASVQAAPWVAGKGADLHRKSPGRFPTLAAGVEEAAKEYSPHFDKHTMNAVHEAIPGVGTGHHAGLLADKRGYWISDTGNGVTLGNDGVAGVSPSTPRELTKQLTKGGLGQEIAEALPEASGEVRRVRTDGVFVDFTKALAEKHQGKGKATAKLAKMLQKEPTLLQRLDDDPRIRQRAQQLLERGADWADRAGPARPDWENAMREIAAGGMSGLLAAWKSGKVALPAMVGVLGGLGVAGDDDPAPGRGG